MLCYIVTVLTGGAFLAPPVYWLGQFLMEQCQMHWLAPFGLEKYFNRLLLLMAIFLWPKLQRALALRTWRMQDLLPYSRHTIYQIVLGFMLGSLGMLGLLCLLLPKHQLCLPSTFEKQRLLQAMATALVVAVFEEYVLRGMLLKIFCQGTSPRRSLWVLSIFFALLHFLHLDRLPEGIDSSSWLAGLYLLPHLFRQIWCLVFFADSFMLLLLVGLTLGELALKSGSLGWAIGLHASWVFYLRVLVLHHSIPSHGFWIHKYTSGLIGGFGPLLLVGITWLAICLLSRQSVNHCRPSS